MSLRVGIDLHVVDGKFQGSRTHMLELFSRVMDLSPDIQFFVFLNRPETLLEYGPSWQRENVTAVRMPAAIPVVRLAWQLPRLARKYGLDIVHTQYILPPFLGCASAVTIHDILFEEYPEYFSRLFVLRSRLLVRWAARHASYVFTVSAYSKEEIERIYGVPPSKIAVIPNGVDLSGFATPNSDEVFLRNRGLVAKKYILTTGRLEPRKNHKTLLRAYAQLRENAPPLVIVGQRDFGYQDLFHLMETLGLADRVRLLEDVGDVELKALYRQASFFVYPSFAEGFGMPPVEAMAAGIPVITSNTTSLPEVVGDAALLIDPHDRQSLTKAMEAMLIDPELRQKLSAQGKERAQRFSWDQSAAIVRSRYLLESI